MARVEGRQEARISFFAVEEIDWSRTACWKVELPSFITLGTFCDVWLYQEDEGVCWKKL